MSSKKQRNEDKLTPILSAIFSVIFFIVLSLCFREDSIGWERQYEYTTGIVTNVSSWLDQHITKVGPTYYTTEGNTSYTLKITLENGEEIELSSQEFDKYKIGDELQILKICKVKGDKEQVLNYNIVE